MSLTERIQSAWNAFLSREPTTIKYEYGSSYRPDRKRLLYGHDRSIVTAVYNRIAVDVADVTIEHVRLDQNGRYTETIKSGLNNCLTLDANLDQTGRAFMMDVAMSMFDEGCVAIVPVDTSYNPLKSGSYDILSLRTGKILEWKPTTVKVQVYNERSGKREEIVLPKSMVAIVENPFYSIMNEPNSTLQRLSRTLANLDVVNEQTSSGKMDLIIQLPYVVKSPLRQDQAEKRRKDIEAQLTNSKYGIAYIDGTERITQLNRPVENQLWQQAKDLQDRLYNQLGLTQSVFDGTADEKTMLNYYNRTIDPILAAISEEMMRKFLTKTARTQGQAIRYFFDPFRLVPVSDIAEIADKLSRNEIATANEIRAEIGWKPVQDPSAEELRNKNMPIDESSGAGAATSPTAEGEESVESSEDQNGNISAESDIVEQLLRSLEKQIDAIVDEHLNDEEEDVDETDETDEEGGDENEEDEEE